jgi:hypothetical protein
MKYILSLIIGGALVVSGFGQTRNVLVGTNNTVVQPTNFWSADASNARAGLGLGTAATNAATAFQPASTALSNLSTGSFIIALTNGGTGATNTATARTNLGLGWPALTNTDATNFRSAIGLGTNAQPVFDGLTILADLFAGSLEVAAGSNGTTVTSEGIEFTGISAATSRTNLGLGATWLTNTNATNFRNAIGLGATWLTNTNVTNFRTAIGLGVTNDVVFNQLVGADVGADNLTVEGAIYFTETLTNLAVTRTNLGLPWSGLTSTNSATFQAALFGSNTNPVLVNTSGNVVSPTNFWQAAPISTTVQYQTNITGTSTNPATNSRNLFLFSLSPSVSGITNTVTLPTNSATTFEGDRATITHLANSTNAVTAIRQLGAATNLITLNQLDETVLLMYRSGAWILADNISYIEPIFFSGTNAAANAAASRTNLGLGSANSVEFAQVVVIDNDLTTALYGEGGIIFEADGTNYSSIFTFGGDESASLQARARTNLGLPLPALTNTNVTNFRTAIGLGTTNTAIFNIVEAGGEITIDQTGVSGYGKYLNFQESKFYAGGNNWNYEGSGISNAGIISFLNTTNAATTRTNLNLGATNNVSFSNVTASGTLTATGTVTATTNLVVNGFVDFSTNHTNSNPATSNQINDFIEIRVGTNQFWLPVYK